MSTTIGEEVTQDAPLVIGGHSFRSRLLVGTGKYRSNTEMVQALEASGAEVVTVAVRRVDLDRSKEEGLLHHLDLNRFFLLANTAGCYTADEAMRYARLAREAGFNEFVKLEVIGDRETLLPDVAGLLAASRALAKEGFRIMAYTNDGPGYRPPAGRCRLRGSDAARVTDRQRTGTAQPVQYPNH